jgi:hypothetical protein
MAGNGHGAIPARFLFHLGIILPIFLLKHHKSIVIISPMLRIARIIAPGYTHHITQRGNNRATVFFDDDRQIYLKLPAMMEELLCP